MSSNRRIFKIAERIRNLVAQELYRLADARFNLVTITSAVVSPDLGQAKIYWVVSGDEQRRKEVSEAFKGASGHLRQLIGKELRIRFVPHLKFFYDDTLDTAEQVERLFLRIQENSDQGSNNGE